jgi:uncharacterized protein
MQKKKLGYILAGSIVDGLVMRLTAGCAIEEIKTGKFVSIVGKRYTFFSLITNLELEVTNSDILLFPPTERDALFSEMLRGRDVYVKAMLRPMLMLDKHKHKMSVKSIPEHFASVYEASAQDVEDVFGKEDDRDFFHVGTPLDMKTPVCLNLSRFTERSNGIFGKTGTGKTFLTRLLLAGLVKNNAAVNLIFDMHSEYGFQARKEGNNNVFVKGLKALFPNKVALFSLDPESTRRRGCSCDCEIVLGYDEIRVEDIITLQDQLNLHPTALEAAYLIFAKYKERWLEELLAQKSNLKDFAANLGAHTESIGALYRKLKRIEKYPFLQKKTTKTSCIDRLMGHLDQGVHIVLEFGTQTSMLCYLLIANIITRRIHEKYVIKTEKFLATQNKADEPKRLMITVEEAHKFLNTVAAKQTIFGIIAREMRKYYVSLLIVDQRPSGIDDEVLSQVGTKLIASLNDEKDIQAVLSGISGASSLRSVLATLDTKKQALVVGHAVPMPVVIKTREYDEAFYGDVMYSLDSKDIVSVVSEIF